MIKTGDLINNRFTLIKKLGEGAFGFVWSAYDNFELKRCAIKFVKIFSYFLSMCNNRCSIKKVLSMKGKYLF